MTQIDTDSKGELRKGGSNGIDAATAPTPDRHYVFGRKDYPKPLEFVGAVSGDALNALDQKKENWLELVAFPEAAVIHVIGDKVAGGQAK